MRWNLGLIEQNGTGRIDPTSDQRCGHFQRRGMKLGWIMRHRNGVQIGQKEKAFRPLFQRILHRYPVPDSAQIVTKMEGTCGLNTGNDTH